VEILAKLSAGDSEAVAAKEGTGLLINSLESWYQIHPSLLYRLSIFSESQTTFSISRGCWWRYPLAIIYIGNKIVRPEKMSFIRVCISSLTRRKVSEKKVHPTWRILPDASRFISLRIFFFPFACGDERSI